MVQNANEEKVCKVFTAIFVRYQNHGRRFGCAKQRQNLGQKYRRQFKTVFLDSIDTFSANLELFFAR